MRDIDDKDEFWSLDSMLPPSAFEKKSVNTYSDVSSVEIEIGGEVSGNAQRIPIREASQYPRVSSDIGKKIDFSSWLEKREQYSSEQKSARRRVENEYVPDNPLIYKVTVCYDSGRKALSERFVLQGKALYAKNGAFNGNVPYYAIFPQYASMSEAQRACYIGFRSCVRAGVFPKVDEAYITLLLFEIINLTENGTPEERAAMIASLITGYPDVSDKLFADMCNYLSDICLIYGLKVPSVVFGDIYPRVLKSARIKELFVKTNEVGESCALLACAGKYDYRTSKFYQENKVYFDRYLEKAVTLAIEHIAKTDSRFREDKSNFCRIEHESYFGAYRTESARKYIITELACITRDDEVKRTVSELAKYAENCLRSALGIKPRLTVSCVNRETKDIIKKYIADNTVSIAPVTRKTTKTELERTVPDYEKMYEPKSEEFSFEDAAEIEMQSWDVTEKLVAAFDDEVPSIAPVTEETWEIQPSIVPAADKSPTSVAAEGEDPIIMGLKSIVYGDMAEFARIARGNGMLSDALFDKINEFLLSELGDVGIEADGDCYKVAEWYVDEINEIIKAEDER